MDTNGKYVQFEKKILKLYSLHESDTLMIVSFVWDDTDSEENN